MQGWFKVHRQLLTHELWLRSSFNDGQAWVDLVGLANHKDGYIIVRGIRYKIKRGQVGWSVRRLAERWRWSRGRVNRFLKWLEMEQQIVPQKNNVTSVITIVNYEMYQGDSTTDDTTSDTTDGPQTDTNKNGKKGKKTIRPHSKLKILDNPATIKSLKEKFPGIPVEAEIEKMKDWFKSKGKRQKDYVAFARNWLRGNGKFNNTTPTKKKFACSFCKTNDHRQDSKECPYG